MVASGLNIIEVISKDDSGVKELLYIKIKYYQNLGWLPQTHLAIESASEMVAVDSRPLNEEDSSLDQNETPESCQKVIMIKEEAAGDGSSLNSKPGDVTPVVSFDVLRFKNNFLEV